MSNQISINRLRFLQLPKRIIDSLPADHVIVVSFEANGTSNYGVCKKTDLPQLTTIEDLNYVQQCVTKMDHSREARISYESQLDVKIRHGLESVNSRYIQVVKYLDDLLETAVVSNDIEKYLKLLIEGELEALCRWLNQTAVNPSLVYKPIFRWVLSLCAGISRTQPRVFEPSVIDSPKSWFFIEGSEEMHSLYELHPMLAKAYEPYIWLYAGRATSPANLKVIFPPMNISLYELRENVYSWLNQEEKNCLEALQFFIPFNDRNSRVALETAEIRKKIAEQNETKAVEFQQLKLFQIVQSYRAFGKPVHQYEKTVTDHVAYHFVAQFPADIKSDFIPDYEGQIVPPAPRDNGVVYRHKDLMLHPVFEELYRLDKIRLYDWCRRMQSSRIAFYLTDIVDARLQKEKLLAKILKGSGGAFEDNSGHP